MSDDAPDDPGSGPAVLVLSGSDESQRAELLAELRDRLPDVSFRRARTPAEDRQFIETAEVVVAGSFDDDLLAHAPELRWVQAISAGVDHYNVEALREHDVTLTNASGVHAEPIAEQVLGYMLVFERNLHRGIRQQADHLWSKFRGGELRGKTLGIVGLGAIGSRVAELGSTLDMRVVGTKRNPSTAPDAVDEAYGPDALGELLRRADYVVLACPLTDETRGMIDAEALTAMNHDAVLVNVARGPIVDEDALVRALQGRRIRGAALDVFETEPLPPDSLLWDLPNVVVTPHMAGSTPAYRARIADIFAENYPRFVAGEPLTNAVVE